MVRMGSGPGKCAVALMLSHRPSPLSPHPHSNPHIPISLSAQVHVFQQGMVPSFTEDGRPFLSTPSRLATNPDGNGGLYRALATSGCLKHMREQGVECVDVVSVDNALARVCDPAFVGYCLDKGVELGARVVAKAGPGEKVGVLGAHGAGVAVVEYSGEGRVDGWQCGCDGVWWCGGEGRCLAVLIRAVVLE